jgi:hypothetical protein
MLRAELAALLRAEIPPLPRGLSPDPSLPNPLPPLADLCSSQSGTAVIRKGQETPLHPPYRRRGDREDRQANRKPHVEYWRPLLAYVDSAYVRKVGSHYPWSNLARKNLWNMARMYSAWMVMALWDLYLKGESEWARRTGYSVYGMIRDSGRLIDQSGFKRLAARHEEELAIQKYGQFAKPEDFLRSVESPGQP